MASTYSTNLAIELIGTGDQAGSWGNTTNSNLGTLIEQAISGYVTQAVSTGTDTTITIPNGSTGVARNMYIELTGTGGASTNLIVPANKKLYFIFNNSTGAVTVKVSGQTGVSVPTGKKMVLVSNGTDIVNGLNYIADFASNSATITHLSATSATITNLTLTSLVISNLSIASANITTLTSASATITNLLATSLAVSSIATFSAGTAAAPSITTTGDTNTGIFFPAADTIAFTEGGVEAARFDSSGNLGLGVTPSAWETANSVRALQFNGGSVFSYSNAYIFVGQNFFRNSGGVEVYVNTAAATKYEQSFGAHTWANAPSGTAGAGITFTERMRLDTSGNLGIGTASPGAKLDVVTGTARWRITNDGSGDVVEEALDSAGTVYRDLNSYALNHILYTSGSERMRLDSSGNLGIGTASPARKLEVHGTPLSIGGTATGMLVSVVNNNTAFNASPTSGISLWNRFNSGGSTFPSAAIQAGKENATDGNYAGYLSFFTIDSVGGANERMRLDSAGSLGLGVTPSAWSSGKAYETTAAGHALWALSNEINVTQNAYFNAGWKYGATAAAARYQQQSGEHKWHIAASGTAGNAISFTQAMTLDASGNLGVGTASPGYRLDVERSGDGITAGFAGGTYGIRFDNGGTFSSGASTIHGVDSTLTTSYQQLNLNGSILTFQTGATERARITSGGNLLVGTTSAGAGVGYDVRLAVDGGAAEAGIFKTSGGSSAYSSVLWNTATTGNNLFALFGTEASITTRGSISYNRAGGLVAYNVTSDYRAKDILGPVQNSGATIDALKVYEGQMKGATQSRPMLVAHEAQEHAPYTVTGEKDAVNEDGTPNYQQMDVSALVPLLLAEVQSLRKRVAELESK